MLVVHAFAKIHTGAPHKGSASKHLEAARRRAAMNCAREQKVGHVTVLSLSCVRRGMLSHTHRGAQARHKWAASATSRGLSSVV